MTLKRPWFTKPFVKGAPPRRASVIARECTSAGIVAYNLLFSSSLLLPAPVSSRRAGLPRRASARRSAPLFSLPGFFSSFLFRRAEGESARRRRRLRWEWVEGRDNRREAPVYCRACTSEIKRRSGCTTGFSITRSSTSLAAHFLLRTSPPPSVLLPPTSL